MLFTTHALAGAAIGAVSQNPFLSFIFGFISHHLLDSMPHFDAGSFYIPKDKGPIWAGAKYEDDGVRFKNKRDWIILFIDFGIAAIAGLYIAIHLSFNQWMPLFFGSLGGLMTDILDVSPFWKQKFRATKIGAKFHKIHFFFHWPLSARYWCFGLAIQAVIAAISLWSILHL